MTKPANTVFPCLVRHGRALEDPACATTDDELYAINARNGLRYLTFGTFLFHGSLMRPANLRLAWINLRGLLLKKDPAMLAALRTEIQHILLNAGQRLAEGTIDEERCDLFIKTLVSNLPLMDPSVHETIQIPQKIAGRWKQVHFQYHKIDISPQTGWQASLLSDKDRIFAFGLEPDDPAAQPFLLVMGTTYPAGQGYDLSVLSDVMPGRSVGESHDFTELSKWIRQRRRIIVTGHSQGGTLSQLIAGEFPEYIAEAHCLNPTGLHHSTLARLSPRWNTLDRTPAIHVYKQTGDPVFHFGDGFLKGTRIFEIDAQDNRKTFYTAHVHHYLAHPFSTILRDLLCSQNNRNRFVNHFKEFSGYLLSPLVQSKLLYQGAKHHLAQFHQRHNDLIFSLTAYALIGAGFALMASGLFIPLSVASGLACCGAGVFAAKMLPHVISLVSDTTFTTIHTVGSVFACTVALTVGVLYAGIRTGLEKLWGSPRPVFSEASLTEVIATTSPRELSSTAFCARRFGSAPDLSCTQTNDKSKAQTPLHRTDSAVVDLHSANRAEPSVTSRSVSRSLS